MIYKFFIYIYIYLYLTEYKIFTVKLHCFVFIFYKHTLILNFQKSWDMDYKRLGKTEPSHPIFK